MDTKYGIIFLSVVGVALGTSCSEAERGSNLAQCLEKIVEAGFNNDLFWFGTQYETDCPSGPVTVDCANPRPQSTKRSIFTRLFPPGYDPSIMDRYLKMVFTSPPDEYSGCGNTFKFNTTWTQEIDPLSDTAVRSWYLRQLPQLEWEANSTEMFTLVVYDVGSLYTHGVYVNIPGNDLTNLPSEQIIKPYHGPQASRLLRNPYIFLLFKQSGQVTASATWIQAFNSRAPGSFDFNDLITQWSLTGPVAMNWVLATGDAYGAQKMAGILNMCPNFVAESLSNSSRPFLPSSPELSVGVNVAFVVTPLAFTVCCSTHEYVQESFELNPIGNPIYDTYKTSQTPRVTLEKKGFSQQATNFTGDMYTLIAVDPDVPSATVGTQQKPLLHWLVTNIPDGNVNSGIEYKTYNGPAPPNRVAHYYYFLLYKQDYSLSSNTFLPYSGPCAERLAGRCLFDINRLVTNENLTLVGASWMTATTDIYVAKRKIDANEDIHTWCMGMPGYGGDPRCPVGASSQTLGSLLLLAFTFILTLFS